MRTVIRTRGFELTTTLRDHVEKKLAASLGHLADEIRQVRVQLGDTNGPRGGVDKTCQLVVTVIGQPTVVVLDTQADLYLAIDRATRRAGHNLERQLARRYGYGSGALA